MVPAKITRTQVPITSRRGITTRSQNSQNIASNILADRTKRKAESPAKGMAVKRSAFGNLTNALNKTALAQQDKAKKVPVTKKVTVQAKVLPTVKTVVRPKSNENVAPPAEPVKKPVTRASLRGNLAPPTQTAQKPKEILKTDNKVKTRLSNEFDKTDESLYTSALENLLVYFILITLIIF